MYTTRVPARTELTTPANPPTVDSRMTRTPANGASERTTRPVPSRSLGWSGDNAANRCESRGSASESDLSGQHHRRRDEDRRCEYPGDDSIVSPVVARNSWNVSLSAVSSMDSRMTSTRGSAQFVLRSAAIASSRLPIKRIQTMYPELRIVRNSQRHDVIRVRVHLLIFQQSKNTFLSLFPSTHTSTHTEQYTFGSVLQIGFRMG